MYILRVTLCIKFVFKCNCCELAKLDFKKGKAAPSFLFISYLSPTEVAVGRISSKSTPCNMVILHVVILPNEVQIMGSSFMSSFAVVSIYCLYILVPWII